MAVAAVVRPNRCQRVGSGRIVAGGTADLGKRGESARIVPRLPSTCPAWFTKITDEPPNRGKINCHIRSYLGTMRKQGHGMLQALAAVFAGRPLPVAWGS